MNITFLRPLPHAEPYDSSSDMWSCGCVAYELATLRTPFRGESQGILFLQIMRGRYAPISDGSCDAERNNGGVGRLRGCGVGLASGRGVTLCVVCGTLTCAWPR